MTHIYGLFRDDTNELVYVGMTGKIESRLRKHKSAMFKESKDVVRLESIESGCHLSREDEVFWIRYFMSIGCILLNKNIGSVRIGRVPNQNVVQRAKCLKVVLTRLHKYVGRGKITPEELAARSNGDFSNMTVRRALKEKNIDPLKGRAIAVSLGVPLEEIL